MASATCPNCDDDLFIQPMNALHAGFTACDLCNTGVLWRSEAGTQTFDVVRVVDPEDRTRGEMRAEE